MCQNTQATKTKMSYLYVQECEKDKRQKEKTMAKKNPLQIPSSVSVHRNLTKVHTASVCCNCHNDCHSNGKMTSSHTHTHLPKDAASRTLTPLLSPSRVCALIIIHYKKKECCYTRAWISLQTHWKGDTAFTINSRNMVWLWPTCWILYSACSVISHLLLFSCCYMLFLRRNWQRNCKLANSWR